MVLIAYLGRRFKSRAFYGTVLVTILMIGNAFTHEYLVKSRSSLPKPSDMADTAYCWLLRIRANRRQFEAKS